MVAELKANPSSKNGSIIIPIISNNPELKDFLSNSSFKFILEGKARTPTTMALEGKATVTYALRAGK